jgi:hypothetical protein
MGFQPLDPLAEPGRAARGMAGMDVCTEVFGCLTRVAATTGFAPRAGALGRVDCTGRMRTTALPGFGLLPSVPAFATA